MFTLDYEYLEPSNDVAWRDCILFPLVISSALAAGVWPSSLPLRYIHKVSNLLRLAISSLGELLNNTIFVAVFLFQLRKKFEEKEKNYGGEEICKSVCRVSHLLHGRINTS